MAEEIENNEEIQSQEENQLEGVDNEQEQGEETQGEETEQNEDGGSSSDGDAPKEDCPPCKGGAPAWMATFADMATLLMAFFVLLLSFAETELPKFKMISGALKNAFGVKVIVPLITIPMARSIVSQEFTPSVAEPTVIPSKKQKSEDTSRKNIVKKTEENEGDSPLQKDFREVQEALAEEINAGQAKVRIQDEKIVVDLQSDDTSGGKSSKDVAKKSGGKISQETLEIAAKITDIQTKIPSEILVNKQQSAVGDKRKGRSDGQLDGKSLSGRFEQSKADQNNKYQQLRMELSEEIDKGLADVLRDGDDIIVRLANQGSFVSGSADLRESFSGTLDRVGKAINKSDGEIKIEGHTDNVPVAFSERFRSNWDLAAARSASVASFFVNNTGIKQERLVVNGFADTQPIDSNDTPAGRAKNRRIEIIIKQ